MVFDYVASRGGHYLRRQARLHNARGEDPQFECHARTLV